MQTKSWDDIKDSVYGKTGTERRDELERDNGSNLTLKTLFDIVEKGLGGKVRISIEI